MDSIKVAEYCLYTITQDEPWQDIGFPKRPKYGTLIQKRRDKWKVDLEKTILQQMLCTLTAAYVIVGKDRNTPIDVSTVVSRYTSNPDVTTALGYASQDEATSHLRKTIEEYTSVPHKEWNTVLLANVRPEQLPDDKLAAQLMLGCIVFAEAARNMMLFIK